MAPRVGLSFRHAQKAEPYLDALRTAGLEPVNITPDQPFALSALAGLVLSGGSDIEPWRYGQDNMHARNPDQERDELELRIAGEAIRQGMPLLASITAPAAAYMTFW